MEKHANKFDRVAKALLYVVAGALPLWFVPGLAGVEAGREISFVILVLLAVIFWLLSVLSTGELRFQLSPVLYAAGLFVTVLAISAFFSPAPSVSFWFAEPLSERVFTAVLGLLLLVLTGSLLRKEDVGKFVFVFLAAAAVSALVNIIQLYFDISIYRYISSYTSDKLFNPVGTQNGLALFYVVSLAMTLGALVSGTLDGKKLWRKLAWAAAALFLANLILINFRTGWIILLGVSVFLFGLVSKNLEEQGGERRLEWRSWTTIGFLLLSVVMIFLGKPLLGGLNLPAEVSPSAKATLDIGLKVFKEGPRQVFFGSGPGTFGIDWGKYKDPSINQTIFWNLRFNQGSSWITTLLPTAGLLGFGSFLLLVFSALYLLLKNIFAKKRDEPYSSTILLGFLALLLIAAFYSAFLFSVLGLFLVMGLVLAYMHDGQKKEGDMWVVEEKIFKFSSPWAVFLSSLSLIFVIALTVAGLYREFGNARAALYLQKGFAALSAGKLDDALGNFEKATLADEGDYRNHQLLTQARTEKIKNIAARAAAGEKVQQEFQNTLSQAVQSSQRAIQLFPVDPLIWRTQGSLYELIIPLVQGAERVAFDSYKRATELESANPSTWVDLGRAGLVFADKLAVAAGQVADKDKEQITSLRTSILQEVVQALQKAIGIKADLAPAHFLLAQTSLRQGNAPEAIRSIENAKLSAPFDIGISFQLGLLYYQDNDLNRARAEFERTLSLNQNYSNAIYFLGLIYDRQGNREKALEQFEKVLSLNPGNQEVEKILANLRGNRDALAGISPPGAAPEKRNIAPLEEREKNEVQKVVPRKRK